MKIEKVTFPKDSILSNVTYDYTDSYQGTISTSRTINQEELGKAFFLSSPKWVSMLMTLRNKIVGIFGLKTGRDSNRKYLKGSDINLEIGKSIGIFKIFDKSDTEIIMGEDDSHLNFRVSLLHDTLSTKKITISTTVLYHNWLGRLYFLPVKPFHKIIVRNMLKRTILALEK